ncbi:MAG: deoxyribodipyrimidine photo-lyase [Gammaproteobacteria bacterium]|nr:deoxyribodipyrimidine photo-lyase [Gammaproteobacteria bacterium]
MACLYWMDRDFRTDDNPALTAAAKREFDIVVCSNLGGRRFLANPLSTQDARSGQRIKDRARELADVAGARRLIEIETATPFESLSLLLAQGDYTSMVRSIPTGYYERSYWTQLQQRFPFFSFEEFNTYRLYDPTLLDGIRFKSFSAMKRKIEREGFSVVDPGPYRESSPSALCAKIVFDQYWHHGKDSYDATRNEIQGEAFSSGVSEALSLGLISVRRLWKTIQHEPPGTGVTAFLSELLWREFFQWYESHYGAALYRFEGIQNHAPSTTFYPERFKAWCSGTTRYPLVNAIMNQLNETGWIANRSRGIAASALVNELQTDWRYGASYFENKLIDYDVGSNWGNWQYIAGVGADPRGGRHFNLQKQQAIYDPEGEYIRRWSGEAFDYERDMVGWPVKAND